MENKPIITCHGDQTLFAALLTNLQSLLPKEPVEWKRSYGRARTVFVEAVFVPFSPQIIPDEHASSSLIGQPCFHVFWTDCDSDTYKTSVKEEIYLWLSALRCKGVSDWLIVVVQTDDRKNKLLPRSSVTDKVKSDFCSKSNERCFQLVEPLKAEMRSMESWQNLTVRLRHLVLQSFSKHINKFEENMRAQRERRNETGWSFSQYFMLQEELAFTFEMFGLFEESLVQYDELDALFTQFVLNHAAGETAQWLNSSFSHDITRWSGLDLTQLINQHIRSLISDNSASLLDFRNYLFSRQCVMLFMLNRPWEVAQRSVPFMHNCLQELAILDLSLPEGAVSSWVFLSCLAVMDACERFADSTQVENYSLYTANLWEYARSKLLDLGHVCGLMPDSETTSHHLNLVVNILAGVDRCAKMDGAEIGPNERLSAALSSKAAFQKNYMELAELAMGTFKHIGRYRSARLIGKDLADFYMRLGEYAKAEAFLSDAYKTFKMEGWDILADHTRVDIASCQKQQSAELKYIKSCCQLSSSGGLDDDQRHHFTQELLRMSVIDIDVLVPIWLLPVFSLKRVYLPRHKVVLNSEVELKLELTNNTTSMIRARSLSVCYRPWTETDSVSRSRCSSVTSQQSVDNLVHHQLTNVPIDAPRTNKPTDTHSQGTFYSEVGKFYSQSLPKEKDLLKQDYELCLSSGEVELEPAQRTTVVLLGKASKPGCYRLSQLCVQVNNIEFLHDFTAERLKLTVQSDPPTVTLSPSTEEVFAGMPQTLSLHLNTGSFPAPKGTKLHLQSELEATFRASGATSLELEETEWYKTLSFDVDVMSPLTENSNQDVSYKFVITSDWLDHPAEAEVTFHCPVCIDHQLLTASEGLKYVRIDVCNEMNTSFVQLYEQCLVVRDPPNSDICLQPLNPPHQRQTLSGGRRCSYVWQIINPPATSHCLSCHFSVVYQSDQYPQHTAKCEHTFTLINYTTLYEVKSEILPVSNDDGDIVTGTLCQLCVGVKAVSGDHVSAVSGDHVSAVSGDHVSAVSGVRCQHVSNDTILYKVLVDDRHWVISGKNSGIFPAEGELSLDVIALIGGYLPLPVVQLYRRRPRPDHDASDGDVNRDNDVTGPFDLGQVYNVSAASRVRVLPPLSQGCVDIKVLS